MTTTTGSAFEALHPDPLRRVELAMEDMRAGRLVIMVDDEDRENEGDFVIAAEKVTPEAINFMAVHGRGLICLTLTAKQIGRLGLPMMSANNQSAFGTAFTVSIEAREGVSTGISAADRARTVQVACDPASGPQDIVTPGHMFPICAREGGVLTRVGQTEGSVDLARLAGLNPAAVICEIMKDDGTMARLPDLIEVATAHRIRIVAVADIIKYRMRNERVVSRLSRGTFELPGLGQWRTRLYRGLGRGGLHMALWHGSLSRESTLVRVQPAPPAWAFLGSEVSRFAPSASAAMRQIHQAGSGAVVFMHLSGITQEHVVREYKGDFEGQSAPAPLARADELRDLGTGCQILLDLGLRDLRLLTNTPRPLVGIEAYGLHISERVPLDIST